MFLFSLFLAIKFPGNTQHPVRQDSTVISAASSSATNGLECPPTLQEQPQAVIPQGLSFTKKMIIFTNYFPRDYSRALDVEYISGSIYHFASEYIIFRCCII